MFAAFKDTLYIAFKDTLLQVLIAYFPAFTYHICLMRPERIGRAHVYLFLFSALSLLFCMLFSFMYFPETNLPFDFRLIPFMIGFLYGGYRVGIMLTAMYIVVMVMMHAWHDHYTWWSDSLLYVAPLLFLLLNYFQQSSAPRRILLLMGVASLGMLLHFIMYSLSLWNHHIQMQTHILLFMGMYATVFLCASCAIIYMMEYVREKAFLQQGYQMVWRQYRQEAQKMHQLIDETPLAVLAVDAHARITAVNQMMLRMLQQYNPRLTNVDIIGRCYYSFSEEYELLSKDDFMLARVLSGEPPQSEVIQHFNRKYLVRTASMRNQETGEIVGAVGMAHDITELSQLRAEMGNMERLSLVGQMAASITHEIRNPMAVVRGFIQLMQRKSPEHLNDYYAIVMEELDRANMIINDFLSLAQNRIVEKEFMHLHDIISNISPLLWADANMRGQEIHLQLADDVPKLLINSKEMKQLLLNLARNGMESMEQKGLLTIETRVNEGAVELLVHDNGPGISVAVQERMFEPFYTTKAKGTGLGLPLCLSIVERHGGVIRIESEVGCGTTFIVSFQVEANAAYEKSISVVPSPSINDCSGETSRIS